jgi:hypothetical protein
MQRKLLFITAIFSVFCSLKTFAQETTSSLTGKVMDEKGTIITNVSVLITYQPTGSVAGVQTNSKGLFNTTNLRPGGPYTVIISHAGFKTQKFENVNLGLGENAPVNVVMVSDNKELQTVVVASTRKTTGGGTNVGRAQISTLPSIGRSLSDFTRLTPQSNNNSFAGSNFRYNNVTLDGAVNNDAIGFSNSAGGTSGGGQSGTAGSGNRTNPYSLETIQEVQVQLAPYDVKLGNFTGGSVNAVTKGGSNDFHGSLYYYGHGSSLVGRSPDSTKSKISSVFHDNQYGASVSGPLVKNKLFFYVNLEYTRHQEPTFYNAGDPGAAITIAQAQQVKDQLMSKYGYDPGSYDQGTVKTSSDKVFARLDWKINDKNDATLRYIHTTGVGNNLERTTTNFQFSSTDFIQHSVNDNAVFELKTKIHSNLSNNLILSAINLHEYREYPGPLSPFIDINGGQIWAGTWREASVYNMRQQTIEFTDNVTLTKGINKFTFGTHNEFYDITYGFVNSYNGRWEYGSMANFLADKPARIRASYSYDPNKSTAQSIYNAPPDPFKVNLTSLYAQDEITLAKGLKITPGIRADYSYLDKQPFTDPTINATIDYISANPTYSHTPFKSLDNKWLGNTSFSPRLGFNYDVKGDQKLIIRGGTGIFTGRMPFAWLGYAYTLAGNTYGTIDYKPTGVVGLAIDPTHIRDTIAKYSPASATTHEVDIVDNNFHLPAVWRSNVAVDIKFGKGYKLTLDALYTKTIYDVLFQQINVKDSSTYLTSGPTQTPVYLGGKDNSSFSNAYLLSNTKQGYRYNLTAQLSKTGNRTNFGNHHNIGLNYMVAYTYGKSMDVSNGIRNSFQSNYELNPQVSPENPQEGLSNFDLRHHIVSSLNLNAEWNKMNTSSIGFFFSASSGSPFSYIYNPAVSAFGNSSNAVLAFIPTTTTANDFRDYVLNGVNYTAAQQSADFNNMVNSDSYLSSRKGKYTERNGAHTPWNTEMDMKLMHEFKFKSGNITHSLQLSFDIFNVLNLLNNDWGHVNFVTNVNNYTVNLLKFVNDNTSGTGIAPGKANYTPTYNFAPPPPGANGKYYTLDPLNSRWQGQFGIRYSF